ncbi:MAG: NfeD family protein [Thermoplasmata archaeon]|nr:NfeD family protein [Thermoplasmata archaeon]
MSAFYDSVGVLLIIIGLILLALELAHPGALLLIPASVLLVGGLMAVFFSDSLGTPWGVVLIAVTGIAATLIELPYYRWVAPTHGPMTTTTSGLTGQIGTVIADVTPDTLQGKVRIRSEIWSARADHGIPIGTKVRVLSGEGVSVRVAPVNDTSSLS